MGKDFFTNLPSEIIMNILSRLPIRTTFSCQCVCKPWLDLVKTHEFVKSHISKSVPGLAVFVGGKHSEPYRVFEFVDELNLSRGVHRWSIVFNFNLPCHEPLHSSANGLLFLCNRGPRPQDLFRIEFDDFRWPRNLFICNPITRDYITLPCPQVSSSSNYPLQLDAYGFGVSRRSGQYKLVRISHGWMLRTHVSFELAQCECQVYTVGTGSWRRIASGSSLEYEENSVGAFLNGNLHWLARDMEGSSIWISCFNLETELFSTFSPPIRLGDCTRCLSVLGDCLCLCCNSFGERTPDDEIVIWLMKEYGDEKSWTKEFIIRRTSRILLYGVVCPIKVFKDGDILMELEHRSKLLYYSSKNKTIRQVDVSGLDYIVGMNLIHAIIYTPSFLSLKTLATENVSSF